MKHNIRKRVINEYGLLVTKIEQVTDELGSGVFDKHGREFFEGNEVKAENDDVGFYTAYVRFEAGRFHFGIFSLTDFKPNELEVVGHVFD